MPIRKTYSRSNTYREVQKNQKPIIESRAKTVYVTEDIENYEEEVPERDKKASVLVNSENSYTPRDILNSIKIRYPILISSCNVTDDVFLAILEDLLDEFIGEGSHKWNFLTIEHYTNLQPGIDSYELPENFDKMISVSLEPDCNLNRSNKPIELTYLDYQKTTFIYGQNYYTIRNNRLVFYNQQMNTAMKNCGYCGHCVTCRKFIGTVKLKYHITAPIPQSMDEPMSWMSRHAYAYLKKKMVWNLYIVAEQNPPQTLMTEANNLFHNLQSWDSNLVPVENKSVNNRRMFDFTGILTK